MSSQSLPSFAQAFSALDDRDRALPPIHSHSPYLRHEAPISNIRNDGRRGSLSHSPLPSNSLPPLKRENRKRALERDDSSEPESPRIVKQEQDVDQLEPSPPPSSSQAQQTKSPPRKAPSPARPTTRARQQLHLNTNVGNSNNANNAASTNNNSTTTATNAHGHAAPPLPAAHSLSRQQQHPSKRRRVTISGAALPNMSSAYSRSPAHSNAHTPPPGGATHTGPSTPISPVVMGFTIQRDPQAFEQVRAMLAVKQKQKALIESRRGSAAGLAGADVNSAGRWGSTAGVLDGGSVSGRRASVAAPSVTVNIVNPTPTTATGPGAPGANTGSAPVAPPLRRTGSSPNGHRLAATPPSLSPNTRANASRTRSPSLLGGARAKSPSPHVLSNQTQAQVSSRSGAAPPPSNLSPPSHHPHPHQHPQANPHPVSTRTHDPSPPQASNNNSGSSGGNNAPPAPPSSSSPLSTHANANPNSSQGQGGSGSGSGSSQNQPPPPQTFVASQGLSALAHNLPPPPNSFTKRRAGQFGLRGNKPADLMISPRDPESGPPPSGHKTPAPHQHEHQHQHHHHHPLPPLSASHSQSHSHTQSSTSLRRPLQMPTAVPLSASLKSLQPAIQSAPPRPGQQPGRFPMALPSLPPMMSQATGGGGGGHQPTQRGTSLRKAPGQVPPTPTRLSVQRAQGTGESASVRLSRPTLLSRVPRTATGATFAIPHGPATAAAAAAAGGSSATMGMGGNPNPNMSLMPATPATLHRASASSTEKTAFLAPFEQFYDALSDAQVLKGWFGEQLRRVGALAKEGEAQLAKMKAASATTAVAAANNEPSPSGGSSSSSSGMVSKAEVESLVREAVAAEARSWREEVGRLRAQVAELQQDMLKKRESESERGKEKAGAGVLPATMTGAGAGRASSPVNGLSPRPTTFQPTPPTSTSTSTSTSVAYPTAPGVDSYTFPPIQLKSSS
ncbi:hypothetical protein ACEPAI_9412 [Sanghuangporus weigelae]